MYRAEIITFSFTANQNPRLLIARSFLIITFSYCLYSIDSRTVVLFYCFIQAADMGLSSAKGHYILRMITSIRSLDMVRLSPSQSKSRHLTISKVMEGSLKIPEKGWGSGNSQKKILEKKILKTIKLPKYISHGTKKIPAKKEKIRDKEFNHS